MENKICGIEEAKIRKAYFKNQLPKLLIDIQALGEYNTNEYSKLTAFLSILKEQDKKLNENFAKFFPSIESEAPDSVLDELNRESLSEAEIEGMKKEENNRNSAVSEANRMLRGLFNKFKEQKPPSDDELMNMAFELLALEYYTVRDALYKERLYRKVIVEYERAGKQRKTAQEYAMTGIAYRDYILAEELKRMTNEFINLVKKRYQNM